MPEKPKPQEGETWERDEFKKVFSAGEEYHLGLEASTLSHGGLGAVAILSIFEKGLPEGLLSITLFMFR